MRKTKRSYFEILNTKKIKDNRTFWKPVVPLFSNKASRGEKIILNEASKKTYLWWSKNTQNFWWLLFKRCLRPKNTWLLQLFSTKTTHILSRLSLKLSKNTPVFSIFKKGNLIQYFHSERLLKRRYWMLSRV